MDRGQAHGPADITRVMAMGGGGDGAGIAWENCGHACSASG